MKRNQNKEFNTDYSSLHLQILSGFGEGGEGKEDSNRI